MDHERRGERLKTGFLTVNRLERLEAMCTAHPDNAFAWYSLALERKKTDLPGALEAFERLHREHPDYLPNYFHYAQTLEQAEEEERAEEIYREGMKLANEKGETHAHDELEAALDLL